MAKLLEERDAGHEAEMSKFQGRIAELLDEKEQREGQLKKTQDTLVTSEAEASGTKIDLLALKEQTTKWEVEIARLNADLASKSSNPLTSICPTYL
jgi:predicted  nucleic acid-binding Zn-ribbon protein